MSNNFSILVIDDEAQIRKLLEITLDANSFKVSFATNGKEGITLAASHQPDLILLDLGLPDEDGQIILKKLREWYQNPIIILSVKSTEEEIVKALDSGANDYLTKPFRIQELLARIRTALRNNTSVNNELTVSFGKCVVDLASRIVKVDNEIIRLTATEYNLLALLVKNDGRVLTHQYILKEIWGRSYSDQTQYLRVFVAQLRKKIEVDANRPKFIVTESGVGYRFNSG
ncbi:MAG: response regulator transcription factor [Bacteroidota bacterium]